ncbi:MAG: flagellar motor protein MotD [Gammaproteobacteria bacterium]|nr:flagellar motor protein MotD [Gammaproteobacteria bacterium]
MKGRGRRPEEHENHERWLVSYADFITLLFAFFVVMYATSSVNEGKYRVLSDSLIAAFSGDTRSLSPIQIGEEVRVPVSEGQAPPTAVVSLDASVSNVAGHGPAEDGNERFKRDGDQVDESVDPQGPGAEMEAVEDLGERMREALSPLIDDDLVIVREMDDWLELEIKTSILFDSGSARLKGEAVDVLGEVATLLKQFPNPIQVEGFTDDVPINTPAYPSNWELSAARAASVVHLFMKYDVRPDRMMAIGYGEYRPIADNETADGRARNRRVVIVIPADEDTRKALDLRRLENLRQGGDGGPAPGAPPAAPG